MRTLLTLACAAAVLTAAAAGTALAGRPVASGDNPFAGRYSRGSKSESYLELAIGGDGSLSGSGFLNTGGKGPGGGGGVGVDAKARSGKAARIAYKYTWTYSGTVSDEGRMLAVHTGAFGTYDWNGWVSLDGNGDLVVQLDDQADPFVLARN